jgi:hypothetical protein
MYVSHKTGNAYINITLRGFSVNLVAVERSMSSCKVPVIHVRI